MLAAYADARATQLDARPLVVNRGEHWCCLLCRRQFVSQEKLCRHLAKSDMHVANTAAAVSAGRMRAPAKRAASHDDVAQPDPKRRAEPASVGSSSLSAMERMELFERRLKSEAKARPASKEKQVEEVDSDQARTINNQMDWECGECSAYNFARVVVCHACKHHVDGATRYLTNRLKDMKQERFARVFGAEVAAKAGLPAGSGGADAGGGAGGSGRAAFQQ